MSRADARYNPAVKTQGHDTQENETGQVDARLLKSTGPTEDALDAPVIQAIGDSPVDQEHVAFAAFMNEPIQIRIATTTDKNAAQVFDLSVNGHYEFFRRGEMKTVKRYFVDRLARLKQTHYTQQEVINAEGIKDILNIPHTALLYDFAVVNDPNPRGADWLAHVQMEPG